MTVVDAIVGISVLDALEVDKLLVEPVANVSVLVVKDVVDEALVVVAPDCGICTSNTIEIN